MLSSRQLRRCRWLCVPWALCIPSMIGLPALAPAAPAPDAPGVTTVNFRLMDVDIGQPVPAMACITGTSTGGEEGVRLPPDGRVSEGVSQAREFFTGFRFKADRNWIGPVRKTMGKGDNQDRSYVYELRPSIPNWTEPVMYQVSGDFTIELPPGKWRMAVQRGFEYAPVVDEFETRGEKTLARTIELKRWTHMAQYGWFSGDVHVHHPMLDDGQREFLLQWAIASDLNVVNVLEMGHHGGTDFKQAGFGPDYRVQRGNYAVVAGQEDPRSTFGHIIGLNLSSIARDLTQYDFYDVAFRKIHEQPGALVGFAHLAWNGCNLPRGFPWYVTTGEIDFVELLQFSVLNTMDYYDYLNLGFRLTAAAGSDMPWGSTIGEVRTYVYTGPKLDLDEWFTGLRYGNSFVTNGPMIEFKVDDMLPGTEMAKNKGESVKVQAKAWGHPKVGRLKALTVVANEGVVKEILNDGSKDTLSVEFDYPLTQSRWLAASAVCENNAVAHTTPVYVIVDGQPTWCPQRGPAVIAKQLEAIKKIAAEFPDSGERGQGIHQRLNKAVEYYENLLKRMKP